jgi:hypothetical protein
MHYILRAFLVLGFVFAGADILYPYRSSGI